MRVLGDVVTTVLLLTPSLSGLCCCLRFAELEVMLAEVGRARGLYELAISQPVLDMPEAVWKAYIDFEISQVRAYDAVSTSRPAYV